MVLITGYGIGPTSVTSGEPNALNGASSRSAASGSPAWQMTSADSLLPDPSGAGTIPAKTGRAPWWTDSAVGHGDHPGKHGQVVRDVLDGVAVEAQERRRGLDRVGDQAAGDHRERVQA